MKFARARCGKGTVGARFCESRDGWRSGGDGARFREARDGWAERRRVRMSAAMAGARESRDGRLERRQWRAFPRIARRMDGAAAMVRVSANLATEDRTAARVRMLRAGHAGTHKPASRILSPFIPRKRPAREPQPLLSDFDQTHSASRRPHAPEPQRSCPAGFSAPQFASQTPRAQAAAPAENLDARALSLATPAREPWARRLPLPTGSARKNSPGNNFPRESAYLRMTPRTRFAPASPRRQTQPAQVQCAAAGRDQIPNLVHSSRQSRVRRALALPRRALASAGETGGVLGTTAGFAARSLFPAAPWRQSTQPATFSAR